jgi:hypothetical protein
MEDEEEEEEEEEEERRRRKKFRARERFAKQNTHKKILVNKMIFYS